VKSPTQESDLRLRGETWLIGQVAAGNQCAFDTLYRAYFPRIARFLGRMTRSTQLVEEIVNDAMLVVWQKAATFDGSCKLSTWVFAIAYRKACKALHKLDEPHGECPDDWEETRDRQPERIFELACLGHAVDAALDALPQAPRAAVQRPV
jgi:RNA polymerase sigma factor (sigma-70 family)